MILIKNVLKGVAASTYDYFHLILFSLTSLFSAKILIVLERWGDEKFNVQNELVLADKND